MKNPSDVMPAPTAALYARLQGDPLLQPYTLIGGTALSLHLGHRISEDLDFISHSHKLPAETLSIFVNALQDEGWEVVRNDAAESYDEFQIAGMELHHFSQSFLVNKEIKLTFFAADHHQTKVLAPPASAATGFAIATLDELFALKALVASSRSKSRDWLDLYLLIKDHGYTLAQWHDLYQKAGYSEMQFETALQRICSSHPSRTDPGFDSLLPNPPTVEEIAAFFTQKRRDYETAKASDILSKN